MKVHGHSWPMITQMSLYCEYLSCPGSDWSKFLECPKIEKVIVTIHFNTKITVPSSEYTCIYNGIIFSSLNPAKKCSIQFPTNVCCLTPSPAYYWCTFTYSSIKTSYTVNWLLFVMYQFSPFSSVPSLTNLCTHEYKYH